MWLICNHRGVALDKLCNNRGGDIVGGAVSGWGLRVAVRAEGSGAYTHHIFTGNLGRSSAPGSATNCATPAEAERAGYELRP